jgi:hypothetical protein
MSECGCASGFGDIKLPGPRKGTWYTIRWTDTCEYCGTPGGFLIDLLDEKDFGPEFEGAPEMKASGNSVCAIDVLNPRDIGKALLEAGLISTDSAEESSEKMTNEEHLDYWLEDELRTALTQAIRPKYIPNGEKE